MALTLVQQLQEAQIEWPPRGNSYFLPINALNELVTYNSVAAELRRIDPKASDTQVSRHTSSICSSAMKLFTVLLCGTKSSYITKFLDDGITDRDLPFVRSYTTNGSNSDVQNLPFVLCKSDHDRCLKYNHSKCGIKAMAFWSQRDIRELCRDQWFVQAPVFEQKSTIGQVPHHDLDDNTVLPFIEDYETQKTSQGGYSHVWGVRIHSAHQNVYRSTNPNVISPCDFRLKS